MKDHECFELRECLFTSVIADASRCGYITALLALCLGMAGWGWVRWARGKAWACPTGRHLMARSGLLLRSFAMCAEEVLPEEAKAMCFHDAKGLLFLLVSLSSNFFERKRRKLVTWTGGAVPLASAGAV